MASPQTRSHREIRKEIFTKVQAQRTAMSANEQAWADRRGEAICHEYRGRRSGEGGPTTLQLTIIHDRRSSKLRPLTADEAAERVAEASLRWEVILAAHGIR